MNIKDQEQLFDIFEDHFWYDKDDIIRDITDKLKELGYSTVDASEYTSNNEYYIHYLCEHGIILGHVWIYENKCDGYSFDISDCDTDNNRNECSICNNIKKEVHNLETKEILNQEMIDDKDKKILDKKTIEEIIKLIESEEYYIVNDDEIIISDEEGIVLILKDILKGKCKKYKAK